MNKRRIALGLAVLELLAALPFYGIYTMAFRFYGAVNYWSPISIGSNLLGIMFLVLPVLGIVGVYKNKGIGYLCMGLFPIVAFIFGVVAIPFANYLYSESTQVNTYFIATIDSLAVLAAIWLYVSLRSRSNNAIHPTA